MENKEIKYSVKGMHCASCEAIIETKIKELPGVKSVEASRSDGDVVIKYVGDKTLKIETLDKLFRDLGYSFSEGGSENQGDQSVALMVLIGGIAVAAFIASYKLGLKTDFINESSSLGSFVIAGLIAGFSTCAAMSGGLVLALAKKWASGTDKGRGVILPSLTFNIGRIISYLFFGGILGFLGERAKGFSGGGTYFSIIISLILIISALNILGINIPGLNFKAAGRVADKITKKTFGKFSYLESPIVGALTFFIPCGFTLSAQAAAIASTDALRGALIMGLFALGTAPALFSIGALGGKLMSPKSSKIFSIIIGIIIIILSVSNIGNQMNVLKTSGWSFSSGDNKPTGNLSESSEVQVIKMKIDRDGYSPNEFEVRVGIPVRWEMENDGTYSCASGVLAPKIFDGVVSILPGQKIVKEFTLNKPGTYYFSCTMGMYTGSIKAIN